MVVFIPVKAYAKADLTCKITPAKIHASWTVRLPIATNADAGAFTLSHSLPRTKVPPAFCFHRKQPNRNTQSNYFPNEVCRIYHGRACSCRCTLCVGEKSTKQQLHVWWSLIFSGMLVQDGWVLSTSSAICHTVPQLMSKPKKYICKICDSSKA